MLVPYGYTYLAYIYLCTSNVSIHKRLTHRNKNTNWFDTDSLKRQHFDSVPNVIPHAWICTVVLAIAVLAVILRQGRIVPAGLKLAIMYITGKASTTS